MLLASLWLSASVTGAPSLPGVGSMTLEDLWRRSEIVVLGRVEKIVQVARDVPPGRPSTTNERFAYEPFVPIAVVEVQRVLRGPEDVKSVLVFAQKTWICDVTRAEPGETALFFLDRSGVIGREGGKFRTALSAAVGDQEVLQIASSGRGRMPVRRVDDRDVVDFWPEVWMPETLAVLPGPARDRPTAVRSVGLAELTATLEGFASIESRPLLSVTAFAGSSSDLAWDLLLAVDGWCRVTTHEPPRADDAWPDPKLDRRYVFRVREDRMEKLAEVLRTEWTSDLPPFVGSASSVAWQRDIRRFRREPTEDGGIRQLEDSIKIARIDEARMTDAEARRHTVSALRIWRELRGAFDVPRCVDLRPDDARWIE